MSRKVDAVIFICLMVAALMLAVSVAFGDEGTDLGDPANAVMKPLVRVRTAQASGSGVLVYSEDREAGGEFQTFVLTNQHVVSDAIHVTKTWDSLRQRHVYTEANDKVTVELFTYLRNGRTVIGQPVKAEIVAYKADEDLALLRLDYPLEVSDIAALWPAAAPLRLLQPVWAVGCSLGVDPTVTDGQITDLEELIDRKPYVMLNAQIIFGNSGGGVFARDSQDDIYFVGIPSRVTVMRGGQVCPWLAFMIPVDRVRRWFAAEKLEFLIDATVTPTASFEARTKARGAPEAAEEMGPQSPPQDWGN